MPNSQVRSAVTCATPLPGPNRRGRGEAGAALVELAVTLPLLAVILIGTIDFGRRSVY